MLENERLEQLIRLLRPKQARSVKELASLLNVSESTVRRDAHRLEQSGMLHLMHGIVFPTGGYPVSEPMEEPEESGQWGPMQHVAGLAAAMIRPWNTVYLGGTAMAAAIAAAMPSGEGIQVVTNGLRTAELLAEKGIATLLAGGEVQAYTGLISGYYTLQLLGNIRPDLCFMDCMGLDTQGQLCDAHTNQLEIYRTLRNQHTKVVFCLTSGRIGREYPILIDRLENVYAVLCDQPLPKHLAQRLAHTHSDETEESRNGGK